MTGRIMRMSSAVLVLLLVFVFAILAAPLAPPARADDPARPVEFAVLDRWVGDWDLEMTSKPGGRNQQVHKATYKSSVRWTLNDRFLRCEARGEGTDGERKLAEEFMWIITFDPQSRAYSSTVHWSNASAPPTGAAGAAGGAASAGGAWGTVPNGVGTWDEKEQMLSIRSEDKQTGIVTLSMTQWIDKDNHRWVQSMTDKNGNLIAEMTGTGKRRPPLRP